MTVRYITLNGSSGYVTVPSAAALNVGTGNFSLSFWAKDIFTADKTVFYKVAAGVGYSVSYNATAVPTGKIKLTLDDGVETVHIYGTVAVGSTGWKHICFVIDRTGNGVCYINGVPVTGDSVAAVNDLDNAGNLILGNYETAFLSGSLDDFRVYKKALSAAEVLAIYNAATPQAYSVFDAGAAAAAFNIDEGSGTTITDEIGGLVGTFTGGVTWGIGAAGTAVIEQIAAEIETAINEITVANGFHQTLTAIRPRRLDFSEILLNDGKVFIWQGDHTEIDNPASLTAEWNVEFSVGAVVIDSETETDSIDTRLNNVAADIQKKLKIDPTRGGFAIDTFFPSVTKIDDAEFTGVIVNLIVHYRTRYEDPYTLC